MRDLETREREEIWSYLDILGTRLTDRQTNGLTELFLKLLSQLKRSAGKLLTNEQINMPKNFQKIFQDTRELIELDQAMTFGI